MRVTLLDEGEEDLERVLDYYETKADGLGLRFVTEFRKGLDFIITHPNAWARVDARRRRYRLHKFPYSIIYRFDAATSHLVILTVSPSNADPATWRSRDRG